MMSRQEKAMLIFIAICAALMCLLIGVLYAPVRADQKEPCKLGDMGCGHMKWHESFYSKLRRDTDAFSCCNMSDCRPTVIQEVGGQLFILADGKWLPYDVKYKATPKPKDYPEDAQDTAHVCAAQTTVQGAKVPVPYCFVLPNGM